MPTHSTGSAATEIAAEHLTPQDAERLDRLRHIVEHAEHLLPAQGPIEVFVHHNTLHAFEDHPFHDAVRMARDIYGAEPYLAEHRYRDMLETGRIRVADLRAVLAEDLADQSNQPIDGLGTLFDLRLAMLLHPPRTGPNAELRWVIAETDALSRFRPEVSALVRERVLDATEESVLAAVGSKGQAEDSTLGRILRSFGHGNPRNWSDILWEEFTLRYLWDVCEHRVQEDGRTEREREKPARVRDALLAATGEDTDRYVHETLIRFLAAFLDQGYADWIIPDREAGLFHAFVSLYGQRSAASERWQHGLAQQLWKLNYSQASPLEVISECIDLLGVPESEHEEFLTQTLLALDGWAGMIWQLESAADWVDRPVRPGSLLEFLAIRLLLDCVAAEHVARECLHFEGPLNHLADAAWARVPHVEEIRFARTFNVFQVAQAMGWPPHVLQHLSPADWTLLVSEIEAFDELQRRRIFHEAYERRYRTATLDALAVHSARRRERGADPRRASGANSQRPSFQIMCCIDDREESFRRHIEEIDPRAETIGAAGFFAVAMKYRGVADAKYKPLCPVIIDPDHYVQEDVGYTFGGEHRRRAEARRAIGRFTHQVHSRSRTFVGGIFTALLGSVAAFPLVARVLFPRLTSQIRRRFGRFVDPPPVTQLQLERYKPDPGPDNGHIGFSVTEMVDIVERLLRDVSLTRNFARLVVITGHGSSSINNPHESAYNCGACAGKRGGPNARAFAQMANDWRVRSALEARGIHIPADTSFLGSYHNTCDDSVVWFDLDRLPPSHRPDFERTRQIVDEARLRNAHERCRRFRSASLKLTPAEALRHVEQRSQDLSQVRPEYNHATDALCFVGSRDWSRGLFLDRRAFLTSYDPADDDEQHSVLLRILAAAIPVCAGINLEYYFSAVDNVKYGSGSKLPHNIASLLGVMEGATSDLRTGLYQQMVEIHEPMRLLFVIECTPEAMLHIMDQHAGIGRLCRGDWVQLAVLDPDTSALMLFRGGEFHPWEPESDELPTVEDSRSWYAGQRGHLPFATIADPTCQDEQ